jgi:molybdenum cofactor cytidylyltransferase
VEEEKIACVVLAAGMSTRFGGIKQLAQFEGKPLLQLALDAANESRAVYILLVVGASNDAILGKIDTGRAEIVFNKEYRTGLASSVRAGVSNLPRDCAAAIFMVADQPFLKATHLDKLIEASKNDKSAEIFALSFHGQPRNPVLIRRNLFPELDRLKGDVGAKQILDYHKKTTHLLEMSEERTFLDVDHKSAMKERAG